MPGFEPAIARRLKHIAHKPIPAPAINVPVIMIAKCPVSPARPKQKHPLNSKTKPKRLLPVIENFGSHQRLSRFIDRLAMANKVNMRDPCTLSIAKKSRICG